ncbi:hypothetical protein M408DRAFT_6812 [Serendipita vermifera MAFF 305830]|uniref:Uncharacterized protein n=1 Tax=Serendipita vermifera MAFF 305830 TaxID=933852 RepID=A0A0C3BI02_SERVB|nr:hypothetical protein M408DRAFT_6812 [Serendipita vermifera MAFF 305830]
MSLPLRVVHMFPATRAKKPEPILYILGTFSCSVNRKSRVGDRVASVQIKASAIVCTLAPIERRRDKLRLSVQKSLHLGSVNLSARNITRQSREEGLPGSPLYTNIWDYAVTSTNTKPRLLPERGVKGCVAPIYVDDVTGSQDAKKRRRVSETKVFGPGYKRGKDESKKEKQNISMDPQDTHQVDTDSHQVQRACSTTASGQTPAAHDPFSSALDPVEERTARMIAVFFANPPTWFAYSSLDRNGHVGMHKKGPRGSYETEGPDLA